MIKTRSIQFRLIIWYSGLIVVISLAFAFYVYRSVQTALYADMEDTLTRRAHQIADDILPRIATESADAIGDQIHTLYSPEVSGRFIRILRADRSPLYVSGKPDDGIFDPGKIAVTLPENPTKRIVPASPATDMFIVSVPAQVAGQSFVIEMGATTDEMDTALVGLGRGLLIGLPIVVLLASAGGYTLVNRALKPVEELRATAEEITFGNLSKRLPVSPTGDAIEGLSITLNQMLERLHEAYQQAVRFSADASHDLRTPLTIMRAELESIIHDDAMLPLLRDRIGSVLEEAERLSHITESLFALSRLDAGEAKMQHVAFDLGALARGTAEQMKLLAVEKQISVDIQTPTPVPVNGDTARLKQVVVDVFDNAIKYTSDGGRIVLKVFCTDQRAVLEVSDNGIGIPADALPHVFERFFRADKVRSREFGGVGLGLSFVRSICLAHGGTVDIQSVEGQGTTCRVELPLAA